MPKVVRFLRNLDLFMDVRFYPTLPFRPTPYVVFNYFDFLGNFIHSCYFKPFFKENYQIKHPILPTCIPFYVISTYLLLFGHFLYFFAFFIICNLYLSFLITFDFFIDEFLERLILPQLGFLKSWKNANKCQPPTLFGNFMGPIVTRRVINQSNKLLIAASGRN